MDGVCFNGVDCYGEAAVVGGCDEVVEMVWGWVEASAGLGEHDFGVGDCWCGGLGWVCGEQSVVREVVDVVDANHGCYCGGECAGLGELTQGVQTIYGV